METRYEHRYANKYIKLVCVGKYEDYIKVREIVCHKDESGNIIDDMDLGATRLDPYIWECAAKSINLATRLPFSKDEIFIYEKVEQSGNIWKIDLKPFQVNYFMNKGIECFGLIRRIEELNLTLHTYYTIVSSEDLTKILPRK